MSSHSPVDDYILTIVYVKKNAQTYIFLLSNICNLYKARSWHVYLFFRSTHTSTRHVNIRQNMAAFYRKIAV